MASDWPLVTIDEIKADSKGSIAIGPFGSRMKSDCYVDEGIPVIRGTNITGGPTFEGDFVYITEEKADTLGSSNVYQYDLVFPHRGSIGEVGIILENERYVLSSSLMKLTCDRSKVNPKFLYYFFKSRLGRHELLKNASQVGTPGIGQPLTSLKGIEFRLPPLEFQDRIEEALTSLDDKIELNRQINQTLEQIAQAIFKSWFVDFEPTRAKIKAKQEWTNKNASERNDKNAEAKYIQRAAMAAIAGKSVEALEADDDVQASATLEQLQTTADLFPDALVESELGEIPEGWGASDISSVTSLIIDHRGKTPKKLGGDWSDEGYPAVSAKNVKSGNIINKQSIRFVDEELYKKWMKEELVKGDVLLTSEGPMGELFLLANNTKYCLSQRLYALRPNLEKTRSSFLYLWLQSAKAKSDLEGRATGTTVVGIRQSELRKVTVLSPRADLVGEFEALVFPFFEKIQYLSNENETLSNIRDSLLPKLLSGKYGIKANDKWTL
ncbi:restriction endonuclease subunit S [Marinibactrum halimedae]|uniref:Type-1 restriction enzyme HindVIIP specificity protein n=1 Tax=Marinibactrum halimedae TaxID=1444977 RepID=A0AA37T488_9GAMM|nr:restriction endonuclease subunit S [Marinibactrum halimedae]MCD9458540.1 restriction endonuclease subunit S [Marinibactrum halimedae]GLS26594.1 putative type-1 restriction enzyme HindVIIP specificity protein [Marinibactrum halimedae]